MCVCLYITCLQTQPLLCGLFLSGTISKAPVTATASYQCLLCVSFGSVQRSPYVILNVRETDWHKQGNPQVGCKRDGERKSFGLGSLPVLYQSGLQRSPAKHALQK